MVGLNIARLLVGSSENCSDLLYATRFFVPDDIIWFEWKKRTHAVFSPLEIDRAQKGAKVQRILPLAVFEKKLETHLGRRPRLEEILPEVLKKHGIRRVEVPKSFPFAMAEILREKKIAVTVCKGDFFPQRQIKTPREIKAITRALRIAEEGLNRGLEILRSAKIDSKGFIKWGKNRLTSEALRGEIDAAIVRLGGLPAQTIVAGGRQACDPHEIGRGPLRARQTIILDIFPRDQKTGYYGDLSRTVVKGCVSEPIRKLYAAVLGAQELALREMGSGADGGVIHEKIQNLFSRHGYKTKKQKGRWAGFFHGTGHSLGLEIHEPPRFQQTVFKPGHVMTVEPGLYYPQIGGVRLEDLVTINATGVRNLTRAEKKLEIS